jgi:hypothetical protein
LARGTATNRVFAFEEPNYKVGVYGEVMTRGWDDTLGRTL